MRTRGRRAGNLEKKKDTRDIIINYKLAVLVVCTYCSSWMQPVRCSECIYKNLEPRIPPTDQHDICSRRKVFTIYSRKTAKDADAMTTTVHADFPHSVLIIAFTCNDLKGDRYSRVRAKNEFPIIAERASFDSRSAFARIFPLADDGENHNRIRAPI